MIPTPIDPILLEILACPVCKTRVTLEGGDRLVCRQCKRAYLIQDGIPNMLVEDAILVEEPTAE